MTNESFHDISNPHQHAICSDLRTHDIVFQAFSGANFGCSSRRIKRHCAPLMISFWKTRLQLLEPQTAALAWIDSRLWAVRTVISKSFDFPTLITYWPPFFCSVGRCMVALIQQKNLRSILAFEFILLNTYLDMCSGPANPFSASIVARIELVRMGCSKHWLHNVAAYR